MGDAFLLPHNQAHVFCAEKQVCTKLISLAILNQNLSLNERKTVSWITGMVTTLNFFKCSYLNLL